MWILLLASALSLASCHSSCAAHSMSSNSECPQPEEIPRCFCKSTSSGLQLKCRRFRNDDDLSETLKALKGRSIKKLELADHNATTISTQLFEGQLIQDLSIEKLEVEDASFRRGKRHFQGLENSLQELEISKSFRSGVRPLLNLQLDHLTRLQVIILEDNHIPEVGNDWFSEGPKELSFLMFDQNGIEELGDRAFSSLVGLKLLAVVGNHLKDVSRSMLPSPAKQLFSLDLAYNKIRELPEDFFTAMPSLKEVNLNHNLIHMIPEKTWSAAWSQLGKLQLEGNPLQCDGDIQWICNSKSKKVIGRCVLPVEKAGIPLNKLC